MVSDKLNVHMLEISKIHFIIEVKQVESLGLGQVWFLNALLAALHLQESHKMPGATWLACSLQ